MPHNALHILLVDDDEIDIMAFARALKRAQINHQLTSCNYAEEALQLLENKPFHCAFVDYQLPGIDGLELLKIIKEKYPKIPVSVLTSQGDEKLAVEMMKSGAFDYFPKSEVSAEKLGKNIRAIERHIDLEAEKEKAQKELREKDAFIQKIVLSSPNIIYVNDLEQGTNIYHNNQIVQILGYNEEEVAALGPQLFSKILDPQDIESTRQHYLKMRHEAKDGEIVESEFKLKSKTGHWVWLLARDTPFKRNEEGKVVEILGTAIDITDRKTAERELLEAKKYAEQAAVAKSEFLSNMSHEIRTPMNAIMGLTDLLLKNDFTKQQTENLKAIKYSADNMLVIINDILDFSKIEAGKLNFENIDFDLHERISLLQKTFHFRAKQKGIYFKILIDPSVPQYLKGDPFRLNQILVNLVGNAIKFTAEGAVSLFVTTYADEICFEVTDTGIGIAPDKLQHIFENFTQAQGNITRKFGGTGLGLAITKRLVEMMKGQIEVQSTEGEGSTFLVSLPYLPGNAALVERETVETEMTNEIAGARILVAEDNPINQMYLKQLVTQWNLDLTMANNGLEVLDECSKNEFDLVLMDVQMPEMDGITATRELRKTLKIPVIALTADAMESTRNELIEAGINDFITKPFKGSELLEKIKKQLIK
ncbi:response regulator [bacterium]|nr:response regulator [bacterium]